MAVVEFRTLGTLDLCGADGRVLHSLLAQPKRLALLSYLCVAVPRGLHRRDVLLAVFWPESDREHARTSLRGALHVLRRSLGEAALVTRGDEEVGIAPDLVWCDAVAFDAAVAAGRLEDALALYRGDLLAGFFVEDAPEFERWLERERTRLRQAAAQAAGVLADHRAAAQDLTRAVSAARRSLELAASDERGLRRLLELLARIGDRAGALEAYDRFARDLAADYQTCPAEPTRSLIERIRAGSADLFDSQVMARAPSVGDGAEPFASSRSIAVPPRDGTGVFARIPAKVVRTGVGLLALGVVSAGTAIGLTVRERRQHEADRVPLERTIAVLPFRTLSVDNADASLAGGLHEALITQLTRITDLHVISRQSVRAYAHTGKPVRQIGHDLGVGVIIDASVQRIRGRVRVAVQLIDARTDKHLWANEYERASNDLFSLETEVALAIAESLQAKLTPTEFQRLARPPTRNAEAYTFFLKGREQQSRTPGPTRFYSQLGKAELYAAEDLLSRAVAADSTFALAHAALAEVHAEIHFFGYDPTPARREQIRSASQAALRLQPALPEGHLAMGYYWYNGRDYARALEEFVIARRGLPSNGRVHQFIAHVYRRQGRWDQALAGHELAFRLAPRESDAAFNLAWTYYSRRRYADAVRTWDYAIAIEPNNYLFVLERARVFVVWQGALDSLDAAIRRIPPQMDPDPSAQTTVARMQLALFRRRPLDALAALKAMRPELFMGDDVFRTSELRVLRAQAHELLGDSVRARFDYDTARAILERGIETKERAGITSRLAILYAVMGPIYGALGRKREAISAAERATGLVPTSSDAWVGPQHLVRKAETFARVGDTGPAVELLERLLAMPAGITVHQLQLELRWDPLRGDPRFQRLLTGHAGVVEAAPR